jgi:two-component system cell cycle response regulator DivK
VPTVQSRVLLVDDFPDALEMYRAYLEFHGMAVLTASDAVTAIALAVREQPAVILMDAGLPGMTGWDAVCELKANPRTRHIPTLIFTGHVWEDSRRKAEECGADGFIAKPCLPDDLIAAVRAAIDRTKKA